MSAAEKKEKAERVVFIAITIMIIIGSGLCLASLLLPYWYNASYSLGQVKIEVDVGLYQDRVCVPGKDCESFWHNDDDYDTYKSSVPDMPKRDTIRGLELAGVINAFISWFGILSLWCNRGKSTCRRGLAQAQFFFHSLLAAFLCVTGTLVLTSEVSRGDIGICSVITGIGCAFLFVPACLSCLICRYDPTYGTLENPISPAFRNA